MSSKPTGEPGWWLASDTKWYPPESHPGAASATEQPCQAGPIAPAGEFEEWYRPTHARLVASLLLVGGDIRLARHAADEAFARACARWNRVQRMDTPVGWIYRVALRALRRARRRAALQRRVVRRRPSAVMPEPAGKAWDLVRVLSVRERTVVVLCDVAELSERDVAVAMGIGRDTVSLTLADAHRALGDGVEPEPIDMDSRDA